MANGKILLDLIEALGTNVSAFEKSIKVSPTRIDKLIKRNSKINMDIVHLITEAIPQVNRQWLLSGEGEMFITKQALEPEVGSSLKKNMERSIESTKGVEEAPDCEKVRIEYEALKGRLSDKEKMIQYLEKTIEDKNEIITLQRQLLGGDQRSKHSA